MAVRAHKDKIIEWANSDPDLYVVLEVNQSNDWRIMYGESINWYIDFEYEIVAKKHVEIALEFLNQSAENPIEIEFSSHGKNWNETTCPTFKDEYHYRVKPKIDFIDGYIYMVMLSGGSIVFTRVLNGNLTAICGEQNSIFNVANDIAIPVNEVKEILTTYKLVD